MPNIRLWKQWPYEAMEDGRAVVRLDGELHRRHMVRLDDPALEAILRTKMGTKYGVEDYPGEVWFFRMDPHRGGVPTG